MLMVKTKDLKQLPLAFLETLAMQVARDIDTRGERRPDPQLEDIIKLIIQRHK